MHRSIWAPATIATVSDDSSEDKRTLLERWIEEQQAWQKTAVAYLDSMARNDEFLVHLGNAMRGSLLAGKPYPVPPAAGPPEAAPADDRLDRILFELHRLQGQVEDLRMTLAEIGESKDPPRPASRPRPKAKRSRPSASRRRT